MLLTVSIVTFRPDIPVLRVTLATLATALGPLDRSRVEIFIIDNSEAETVPAVVAETLAGFTTRILQGHGNIGFGRGHNLVLPQVGLFHLILNPDIEMEPTALIRSLEFMRGHPECGLLSPLAFWPDGTRQYLCKRYPAAFDLFLRGFAPQGVKRLFAKRLARYELRKETAGPVFWDPPIVSGCFMFFRGQTFRVLRGFDPRYMLYFEDFDLSLRSARYARTAYVADVEVIHAGGHASRKGFWHLRQFLGSSLIFYRNHGFKIL
jgi:GT2 family glycosyltransferase